MNPFRIAAISGILLLALTQLGAQDADPIKSAQAFRKNHEAVAPVNDSTVIAEAEEFQVLAPGWQAKAFGTNYHAATFANCFLSRKAYLGAPEQCDKTTASIDVQIPKGGKYLALVRYEAAYRFETQFKLQVEQNGKVRLDRLYGARDNVKIWAFGKKLQKEVAWDWGASETIVWEGHDAAVELEAGKAKLTLIAENQPKPAARRNVDLVMLTSDQAQVKMRIDKEQYLPLDGMLTQAGDVYLKVHNAKDSAALTLTVPNGTEHSPYWVHIRNWKPVTITAEPGQTTEWTEVGALLDSLSDGQWTLTAAGKGPLSFDLEVGVKDAAGKIESIRKLEKLTGNVALTYSADMRYSRRIRTADEIVSDLVDYLKKQPAPHGSPLKQTLVFGYTFDPQPGNDKRNSAIAEFIKLMGGTAIGRGGNEAVEGDGPKVRGYIDVRGVATKDLEAYCAKLKADGKADKMAVVSLGDEIGLAQPPANDHAGFRTWLKTKGIKPADLDPAAGEDHEKLMYSPAAETAKTKPGLYYYSHIYAYRFGIDQLKQRTAILKQYLPNAGIGANFSPHHGHMFLGPTHQWISLFREDGMTMPWGEDYIFQVPMASQQVNSLMVDMFRASLRNHPDRKIHYYVMPHSPNNTVNSWRRQFFGDIAHGVKIFNLFEFRPVQAAYTENHCSDPAMYQEVRKSLHELGGFEEMVQDGQVRPAKAGLWFSEAADVWDDNRSPFDAGKRCLYLALRQAQVPLDIVIEGDDLKSYEALYLTDPRVSRQASKAIADWVNAGGKLYATAGAGMFDELNQPNQVLRALLGVEQSELVEAKEVIRFEKQDLPFAEILDHAKPTGGDQAREIPVFGVRAKFSAPTATVSWVFADKSPAVAMKKNGKGEATLFGFLPGLSYMKPALPVRPFDRGATDDAMTHFLPENVNRLASSLLLSPEHQKSLPIYSRTPLVESTVIESKHGVVIPLVNWTTKLIKGLEIEVSIPVPAGKMVLASGKPVTVREENGKKIFTLDLDVADALILRR